MTNWGRIEVGTVATISTAHIPPDAAELLEAVHHDRSREVADPSHWINSLQWGSTLYAFMVHGHGLRRLITESVEGTPDFLLEAARLATDLNLAWLCYDQDGDEVEGMTSYDEAWQSDSSARAGGAEPAGRAGAGKSS